MNRGEWQLWYLIACCVVAGVVLFLMLWYRHQNKTTIETDLLLKQMRLTSRMRTVLGAQKGRLEALGNYDERVYQDWELARAEVQTKFGYDIGEMEIPPVPTVDLTGLFDDLDE